MTKLLVVFFGYILTLAWSMVCDPAACASFTGIKCCDINGRCVTNSNQCYYCGPDQLCTSSQFTKKCTPEFCPDKCCIGDRCGTAQECYELRSGGAVGVWATLSTLLCCCCCGIICLWACLARRGWMGGWGYGMVPGVQPPGYPMGPMPPYQPQMY